MKIVIEFGRNVFYSCEKSGNLATKVLEEIHQASKGLKYLFIKCSQNIA